MAINAYTGVMGSGKSFEVVASVIVPAIEQGRRVVTNVDGINEEKIHEFITAKGNVKLEKLGRVIHIKNEDISKPGFFPDEDTPDRNSVVQAGDLVAIDEAWRFWGQGEKISAEHMQFFRMHRHYVHPETKIPCDVVLMVQSIGDLNRNLRAVVEMTAIMTKLKTLGLNKKYRVELFEGGRTIKSSKFETYVNNYDKKIFPLYQSYSGGQGNEKAIDKRQNVLKNPRIMIVGAIMICLCLACSYYLWWFFKARTSKNEQPKSVSVSSTAKEVSTNAPTPPAPPTIQSKQTETLRIAGEVILNGERWIAIADQDGRIRFENPALFVGKGMFLVGNIEGQRVTPWSGSVVKQRATSGVLK